MYAAVRRYILSGGNREEVHRAVEGEFVPLLRRIPGFHTYFLVDSGNDEVVTISVFEGSAGAETSVHVAAEWARQNATIRQTLRNPPEVMAGDVSVAAYGEAAVEGTR